MLPEIFKITIFPFLRGKNSWNMKNFYKDMKQYSKEDISSTVQSVLEEILKKYVNKNIPKESNLLLSGGIFANVKLNQKIKEINNKRYLFVTPPMSDFGLCLGGLHKYSNSEKSRIKKYVSRTKIFRIKLSNS